MFRNVCIRAMERKVTEVLMVKVERRSKFMGLWMRFIPVDLNNAKVHCLMACKRNSFLF
jgi:hypothetical protein